MCQIGVSNAGHSSSVLIGLSNDCKWVQWCHAVVHFEVKIRLFSTHFHDDHREHSGRSPLCQVSLSNEGPPGSTTTSYAMSKTRNQLGSSRKS